MTKKDYKIDATNRKFKLNQHLHDFPAGIIPETALSCCKTCPTTHFKAVTYKHHAIYDNKGEVQYSAFIDGSWKWIKLDPDLVDQLIETDKSIPFNENIVMGFGYIVQARDAPLQPVRRYGQTYFSVPKSLTNLNDYVWVKASDIDKCNISVLIHTKLSSTVPANIQPCKLVLKDDVLFYCIPKDVKAYEDCKNEKAHLDFSKYEWKRIHDLQV